MSYTPEPWKVEEHDVYDEIIHEDERGIHCIAQFDTYAGDPNVGIAIDPDVEQANARRIVACVNGCAGLNPASYRKLVNVTNQLCEWKDVILRGIEDVGYRTDIADLLNELEDLTQHALATEEGAK